MWSNHQSCSTKIGMNDFDDLQDYWEGEKKASLSTGKQDNSRSKPSSRFKKTLDFWKNKGSEDIK